MAGPTALEFYSGIGGMHYALQRVCPAAVVLDAFDINNAANAVYAHNFGKAPKQVDVLSLTAADLDAYAAELWLMAPPCQPFTRQGRQLGAADARSSSFQHLLQQLQHMRQQPRGLLVENVVGFQGSDVCCQLRTVLAQCGYHMQEFILTPTQYGVPYSRPRYFCVASKQPLPVPIPDLQQPCLCTPTLLLQLRQQGAGTERLLAAVQQPMATHVSLPPTLGEYLSLQPSPPSHQRVASGHQQQQQQQPHPGQTLAVTEQQQQQLQQQQEQQQQSTAQEPPGADCCMQQWAWVPDQVLQRHADVIDVVCTASRSCNCFTKAYGHFARGTGSLLATVADPSAVDDRWQLVSGSGSLELRGYTHPSQQQCSTTSLTDGNSSSDVQPGQAAVREVAGATAASSADASGDGAAGVMVQGAVGGGSGGNEDLAAAWRQLRLRYFTVTEIAELHSFPGAFSLPGAFSSRQGYQLLGNSLSVAVVADLLAYLLPCVA